MKKNIYKVVCAFLCLGVLFSPIRANAITAAKVQISSRIGELLFGAKEERTVCVGGGIFGAKIKQSYVSVVESKLIPKLRAGDVIISVAGYEVSSIEDVEKVMTNRGAEPITITARRGENVFTLDATPVLIGEKYKLGVKLKDTASGIGTVTFIDKESGSFGGLGHGIYDIESGELVGLSEGEVTGVLLGGINKGEAGKPGELCGVLTGKCYGTILKNTECGVFGKISTDVIDGAEYEELPLAKASQVHTGHAEILCTVKNGYPQRYSVEITEIGDNTSPTKSFKICVTDKTLIAITGGIVRGMSGSPIIQDGKLIGAVTHVMVADPTEGYGIFIENMLNAAQMPMQKAA